MQKTCANNWCSQPFDVSDADLAFYEKISPEYGGKKYDVPPPTLCPECRLQRRFAIRNERRLCKRTCDRCKKMTISSFPVDSVFPVYCNDCWWSDAWSPTSYGQEYDFSRPFFEQFEALLSRVPKSAALQLNNENSEWTHLLAFSKNAYLCPGSFYVEDCMYMRKSQYCRDCINSTILNRCELIADSVNCDNCSRSHHLVSCRNCSSSAYLIDCSGLKDCFLCSGITNKQYCFKNEQLTKETYENVVKEYASKDPEDIEAELHAFSVTIPKRAQIQFNCQDCTGDYLYNCKNVLDSSDCFSDEDGRYLFECEDVKDSMDITMHDKEISLCYELCSGGEKNYMLKFSYCGIASPQAAYCFSCFYAPDCFGCDGYHGHTQFCILNKQYTEEEYNALMPKIIEHMQSTGEWGEFFPISISPYPYNDSVAQDYFPLDASEAKKRGWKWREGETELPAVQKVIPGKDLPRSIDDVPDDIVEWAVTCEATGRPFKIIKQELGLYRKMGIPVPRLHPDERHRRRMALRNPRKLWERTCAKCSKNIQTTYSPDRPEIVYCEECYLKEVY